MEQHLKGSCGVRFQVLCISLSVLVFTQEKFSAIFTPAQAGLTLPVGAEQKHSEFIIEKLNSNPDECKI